MIDTTVPLPSATASEAFRRNVGLARMLCGGVILDVTTPEQAKIAEDAGAVAVMALERVPAEIRKEGGVARMASIDVIRAVQEAVTIPVMAKARIGPLAEARVLEELGVDFVDESEVLTPADPHFHIDKTRFKAPFVCGATNLGEALRRISEGAAMLRTKGEAGTGDVSEAVRHLRQIKSEMRMVEGAPSEEWTTIAKNLGAPRELVGFVAETGQLPVPNFAAGGVATPADAALLMELGAEAVFVGSGVFLSEDPTRTAAAIVKATAGYRDVAVVTNAAAEAGGAMRGRSANDVPTEERLAVRGW